MLGDDSTTLRIGTFAYGIPTAAGDIPLVGTASYQGEVSGHLADAYNTFLGGSVNLNFDFAAGTLGGDIDLYTYDFYYDSFDIPRLTFSETLFAAGSQTFSGKFDQAGVSRGTSFQGQFTGPGAVELLSSFKGEVMEPGTDTWHPMGGVWIARKQ